MRVVVLVAVGTADVKQKEKRKTNHLFTRMGGRQYGQMNGCGSGHLCMRHGWMVVVLAVDPADVKKKSNEKYLLMRVGGS